MLALIVATPLLIWNLLAEWAAAAALLVTGLAGEIAAEAAHGAELGEGAGEVSGAVGDHPERLGLDPGTPLI